MNLRSFVARGPVSRHHLVRNLSAMRVRFAPRILAVLAAGALVPAVLSSSTGAAGPNLVANGDFAAGLSTWKVPVQPGGTVMVSGTHAVVAVSEVTDSKASVSASQCVTGIVPGATYEIAVDILIPPGQKRSGNGSGYVNFFNGANCTGGVLTGISSGQWPGADGLWHTKSSLITAPAAAISAAVGFGAAKAPTATHGGSASDTYEVWIDNVSLSALETSPPPGYPDEEPEPCGPSTAPVPCAPPPPPTPPTPPAPCAPTAPGLPSPIGRDGPINPAPQGEECPPPPPPPCGPSTPKLPIPIVTRAPGDDVPGRGPLQPAPTPPAGPTPCEPPPPPPPPPPGGGLPGGNTTPVPPTTTPLPPTTTPFPPTTVPGTPVVNKRDQPKSDPPVQPETPGTASPSATPLAPNTGNGASRAESEVSLLVMLGGLLVAMGGASTAIRLRRRAK